MARLPTLIPVSDLRKDVAEVLQRVERSQEAVIITQRGRAAAVMLSMREYQRAENERQVLRALALGQQEIAAGKGYDLESVLRDADAVLGPLKP